MTDTQTDIGLSDEAIELLNLIVKSYYEGNYGGRLEAVDWSHIPDAADELHRVSLPVDNFGDYLECRNCEQAQIFAATIDRIRSEEREVREAAGRLVQQWHDDEMFEGELLNSVELGLAAALTTKEKDDE